MKEINSKTTLGEIINIEGVNKILEDFHVPCVSCPFAQFELNSLSLGDVCRLYGINEKKLIEAINDLIKKRSEREGKRNGKNPDQKK